MFFFFHNPEALMKFLNIRESTILKFSYSDSSILILSTTLISKYEYEYNVDIKLISGDFLRAIERIFKKKKTRKIQKHS